MNPLQLDGTNVQLPVPKRHLAAVLSQLAILQAQDSAGMSMLSYATFVDRLQQDQGTSFELQRRLATDSIRDPVDAANDAELLLTAAILRLRDVAQRHGA